MSALTTAAATAIAATSAAAAVGSFFAYLHFAARTEAHAARDEALALAHTRGEVIADLRLRVDALERQLAETTRDHDALAILLYDIRADLERSPPDVERPDFPPGLSLPQLDLLIVTAGGKGLAIRRERGGIQRIFMTCERAHQRAVRDLPLPHLAR